MSRRRAVFRLRALMKRRHSTHAGTIRDKGFMPGTSELRLRTHATILMSALCALGALHGTLRLFPFSTAVIIASFAALTPFRFIAHRARKRARDFAEDFPAVLFAMASSLKAGLPPYEALQRSVTLLPTDNVVRKEVMKVILHLNQGMERKAAIDAFAKHVQLTELRLFRAALLLVLEEGGQFAPTLERLARVVNDRLTLLRTASVSTSVMRMTANILLCIAPALLLLVSARTPDFWELFRNHPVASMFSQVGTLLILSNYWMLKRMSSLKL